MSAAGGQRAAEFLPGTTLGASALRARSQIVADTLSWLRHKVPSVFSERHDLHLDSRRVKEGDVFIALRGDTVDGRNYLPEAAANGAVAALVDARGWDSGGGFSTPDLPVRAVDELDQVLGPLAADFYRHPSEHLLSIAVTGTNGKTSSTQWIAQLLTGAGRRCAVIGTIGLGFAGEALAESLLTTPDPVSLQRDVRALLDAGAQALAMEVSSIGLQQGRLNGMKVDVALFTNLTRDHLDYHGSMQQYEAAKSLLFEWPTLSHAVVNLDDSVGRRLVLKLAQRGIDVIGYSVAGRAEATDAFAAKLGIASHLTAQRVRATARGIAFDVALDGVAMSTEVPLVGQFNVENLLGVLGVLHACGIDFARAMAALPQLEAPTGRMQQVAVPDAPLAVVDYAHTPDALAKALAALRPLVIARSTMAKGCATRSAKLWVVFGAGGDRDQGKRPAMGAVAAEGADVVVVTSDNPRSEDASAICAQIATGACDARGLVTIVDRGDAIAHAIASACSIDVVLIAGKGHESYQIVGKSKAPFSDVAHARAALAKRAGAASAT
ncbi:MAG: UDP-N-acetylmuramoyl-L-alanyl-D-glutamate--2,6-diaminopimelate ligase [Burkholderiaceae bacterium]|nr:UDP-N-acetylmuramoyl-L-alanyl-D-glutamate--2,6-diaminopimelate ligase [Burkholderiaceae bacterium]